MILRFREQIEHGGPVTVTHPVIKIEFTGLRHGEKLYEELLNVKEQTQPTYHEKIMIASVREYDYDDVKERIARLVETSYGYDDMETVRAMKALVPEFISKNSCFERLDPPVSAS